MITIDQIIAEKIGELYINEWPIGNLILCISALILSLILCGAIGFERERKGSNAGLRTHLLVGVGSCLIMIISVYGFPDSFKEADGYKRDVARLAAAVVTGVGFLGAGSIIHRNAGVTGLTTAATIWISMAIGLACGSMNFILATGCTILILVVLVLLVGVEGKYGIKKGPLVTVRAKKEVPVISNILEASQSFECQTFNLQIELVENNEVEISFVIRPQNKDFNEAIFVSKIENIEGIHSVFIKKR